MAKGYAHLGSQAKGYRVLQARVRETHPLSGEVREVNTVPRRTNLSLRQYKADMQACEVLEVWTVNEPGDERPWR